MQKLCLALLLLFSVNTVKAAIIDMGDYVQNTSTQLDWLKLSFTDGKSFDQVSTLLTSDPFYAGYEFATRQQVETLFSNFYGGTPLHSSLRTTNGLDFNKTYDFIELIGATFELQDGFVAGVTQSVDKYITRGYVTHPFGANKHYVAIFNANDYLVEQNLQDEGVYQLLSSAVNDNVASDNTGAFLVRNSTVSAVLEPQAYMLLLAGLLLFRLNRRTCTYKAW